jgi:integrase
MGARGCGAGTIKAVRAALSAAYSDAKRHGDLVRNPVENVKMPNIQSVPTKHIPRADWEKIYIASTQDPYTHARIEIAGTWELRPGEALGLKWSDLDVQNKTLRIARR